MHFPYICIYLNDLNLSSHLIYILYLQSRNIKKGIIFKNCAEYSLTLKHRFIHLLKTELLKEYGVCKALTRILMIGFLQAYSSYCGISPSIQMSTLVYVYAKRWNYHIKFTIQF